MTTTDLSQLVVQDEPKTLIVENLDKSMIEIAHGEDELCIEQNFSEIGLRYDRTLDLRNRSF